ncbi:hypothetical protein BJV82DRAFT_609928 [Fennellomyces sp. T-0311]|nr:hypothetical protein BJV82DRAFT_609928 [Fennellomyces sp. T-0311]
MDNMVVYNVSSSTWSRASVNESSPLPESRAQMSATVDTTSGIAWLYGGRATEAKEAMGERAYYNDFYSYNTLTSTWDWPAVRYAWGQRPARFGHTSNLVGNQLFILGGKTAVVNASGDTWVINPADFQSVLVFDTDELKAVTMATIGDIPNGKVGFSSSLAPDGHSIVIFGGEDAATGENTQDLYLLDTCTLTWSRREVSGIPPSARSGHQAVSYDNYMLVLMGFKDHDDTEFAEDIGILDMSLWQWVDDLPRIEQAKGSQNPDCKFTFPHMPDNNGNNGGNNGLPYDPTVISNPNQSGDNTTAVALGATFGVIGFILCVGALVLFIRRLRKNAHTPNPRWLPGALKKEIPPPQETDTTAKPTVISMDNRSPERPPATLPNPVERV